VSVTNQRVELLQLDDHLMTRQGWKPSADRVERAVELRRRHVVKKVRMVRRHLLP